MSSNPIFPAIGRLEDAVRRLEGAIARRPAAPPVAELARSDRPTADPELVRLRAENAELAVAADTVSSRLDRTIERLKTVLDA